MDNNGTQAPEKIVINGQEYSLEDATRFIDLGRGRAEMESKLNTSLDKVYPEYTKASQRNKELENQLAERTAELEKYQKAQTKAETPDEIKQAREAARKIGLADEDYLKEKGYMTRSEMDAYFSEKETMKRQTDQVLSTAAQLEKEIDGSDGRVPFDQKAVLAYASAYQISDLKEAYTQMNERGNAKWKEAQLAREERPGLNTLKPGGAKQPQKTKINDNNLGQVLGEWLDGIE